ncbi:MAG: hypothetical protein CVV02_05225 [Firmicutes bacterium HGW-Firmicutes-7]|nr:MAG: hypothetical protein CVV02_05225 [Firmicutes bacterium HGW-Firmicutes-7]
MQLPNIFNSKNALLLQSQVTQLLETNMESQKYGLILSPTGALELLEERNIALKNSGRLEFDSSLTLKIIHCFCNSPFIQQDDYETTLIEIQEIFYDMKNETEDSISDDDLLSLLKNFFDHECDGDIEYLKGKYLDILSRNTKRHNQTKDFFSEERGK